MASIRARDGKLFLDFYYANKRCREQTQLSDTPLNRRKLAKILNNISADISLEIFVYRDYFPESSKTREFLSLDDAAIARKQQNAGLVTIAQNKELRSIDFAKMAIEWLEVNICRWKPSYRKNVERILNKHLLPTFGTVQLHEIDRHSILQFRAKLADLRPVKSADYINHVMTTLRGVLLEGCQRYSLPTPYQNIKTLRVPQTQVHPFTLEEMTKIINAVRADFQDYFIVRFLTGMRTGEIDGLQWKHIDFDRKEILIRQALTDGRLTTTKTPSSVREIQMSAPVIQALQNQYARTGEKSGFVFCNSVGGPLDHRNVRDRIWKPLLNRLEIEYRRPYETRHTTATLWLAAGENPEWIARQLGHANTQMLFKVYSRYVPNLTRNDGASFDALIQQKFTGGAR